MRDTFVKTLLNIAKDDPNVHIITGDLGFGVLKPFWEQLPNQITNVGIAEQNMTGFATGMALEGKIVFTYSIGNFPTLRTLEQIRNDAAYHDANVKIVCVGGGFVYGSLGMSHHATEDIAIMRALPNVKVFAPGDLLETKWITEAIYKDIGVSYLRLGRGGEKTIHKSLDRIEIGKAVIVNQGKELAILSTGAIFEEVDIAIEKLHKAAINPTVVTFPSIKPIDLKMLKDLSMTHRYFITVEEHNLDGGFGSAIIEALSDLRISGITVTRIGLKNIYSSIVGTQKYLRGEYGINSENIYDQIMKIYKGEI